MNTLATPAPTLVTDGRPGSAAHSVTTIATIPTVATVTQWIFKEEK